MPATRFPLCPVAERLSASRPCAVGAPQRRHGEGVAAAGSCCASRTSTPRAAGRNTKPRSMRISPGSASPGKSRCGGSRSILTTIARRWRRSRHGPRLSEFREPRRDRRSGRGRASDAPWPRDPDGVPLYPGTAKTLTAAERAQRIASGVPYALRLDMAAALARVGPLTWIETGAGPDGETGTVAADPAAWGDVILARKDVPTSYHLAVVVDDAAQGVTDVVRGRDLFHATAVHRLLAGAARPGRAALPPSSPAVRCRRPQAVEIDAVDRPARAARARLDAARHPPPGRARLNPPSVPDCGRAGEPWPSAGAN